MFFKKWPKKSNGILIRSWSVLALCFLPMALASGVVLSPCPAPPEKVSELQSHFDHESHAASKIRILEKLGHAQFASATAAQQAGDFNEIGLICEKFRDNVRAAFELLKKQEPNAEKHDGGYRHLELQTRRGIREVEDLLIIVPQDVRPPIEIVRGDLIQIDDELIRLLFPRRSKDVPATPPPTGAKP